MHERWTARGSADPASRLPSSVVKRSPRLLAETACDLSATDSLEAHEARQRGPAAAAVLVLPEYTATVWIPIRFAVRMTRHAISPRLAIWKVMHNHASQVSRGTRAECDTTTTREAPSGSTGPIVYGSAEPSSMTLTIRSINTTCKQRHRPGSWRRAASCRVV